MGAKIRSVRAAAITAGTTQDFTIAGLGAASEIKGARFFVSRATVDDTSADHSCLSVGITDGTRSQVIASVNEDNQSPTDSSRRAASDEVIQILALDGTIDGEANFDSFITDGIRINWGVLPAAGYLVTCVLIVGASVECRVDSLTTNATQDATTVVTSLAARPEAIFAMTNFGAVDDTSRGGLFTSLGFAADGATIEQASWFYDCVDAVTPSTQVGRLADDRLVCAGVFGPGFTAGCEVTAFSSNGFTVTTRDGAGGDVVAFMALSFGGDGQASVGIHTTPVVTGDQATIGIGFKPGYVEFVLTQSSANGVVGDNRAGSSGVGCMTSDEQFAHNVTNRNNQNPSQTTSYTSGRPIYARSANGTGPGSQATLVSLDVDGWTLNYSAVISASGRKFPFLAIELPLEVDDAGGSLPSLTGAGVLEQQHELSGGGSLPSLTGAGVLEQRHELGGGGSLPSLAGAGVVEQQHELSGGGSLPSLTGAGVLEQQHELGGGGSMPSLTGAGVLEQQHVLGGGGNLPALTGAGVLEQQHELSGGGLLPIPVGAGVVVQVTPLTPDPLDFSIDFPAVTLDDPNLKPDPLDFSIDLPAVAVFTGLGGRLLQFDATIATDATYTDAEIT